MEHEFNTSITIYFHVRFTFYIHIRGIYIVCVPTRATDMLFCSKTKEFSESKRK